jgi:iron(III) transport system ATP-binding protein
VDAFVADFIGEANLIPCDVVAIDETNAEVDVAGYRCRLPSRGLQAGAAQLAVRPARIALNEGPGFEARIAKSTYVGVRMEYSLETSFGSMFAVQDDVQHPLEPGTAVQVSFKFPGPVLIPS